MATDIPGSDIVMKKTALLAVSTILGLTASASAADLAARPVYTKAPVMSPVYNWTGFYVGANAGYAWGKTDATLVAGPGWGATNAAFLAANGSPTLHPNGFIGGGQIGYNWQFAPTWVFGLETDIASVSAKATRATGVLVGGSLNPYSETDTSKINWLGTVRGRVGYVAGPVLIYGTGGLAYGEAVFSQSLNFIPPSSNVGSTNAKVGWTAGGGLEYALGSNWSVKGEYLYVDLGKSSFFADNVPVSGTGFSITTTAHTTVNIVRLGFNYKFGGPVVARY